MKQLILGGVRSGKSHAAEQLAADSGHEVVYIATAEALDREMQQRIELHRQRRPAHWRCVEESLYLAAVLQEYDAAGRVLLVDCLTLWLSNLLLKNDERFIEQQLQGLLAILPDLQANTILVSSETGLGITPANELSRHYADRAGLMNQQLAAICDRVIMVMAGLPLVLKGEQM